MHWSPLEAPEQETGSADAIWRFWSAPEGGGPWPMAAFRPRGWRQNGPGAPSCARPFAAR